MENKTEPAIAVLPYRTWKTFNLNSLSLDLLEWPLGRPDRLKNGTIRDMIKNDHLITFPRKSVFLFPRPLIKAKISVMIVEPDAIHNLYINISKYLHWRFYKILTKNKYLLEEIHNTSFFYFGSTFIQNSDKIDLQKKKYGFINCI